MTHYFQDPKSGANYPFKGQLPSADMNGWIGGIRAIDGVTFWQSLRFTELEQVYDILGLGVHENAGVIIEISAERWRAISLGAPGTLTGTRFEIEAGVFLPGVPTLTSRAYDAYNGSDLLIFANADTIYKFPETLAPGGITPVTLTDITNVDGLVWSNYSGLFIACGRDAASAGVIETSPDADTWTSVATSAGAFAILASDLTGRYLLAAPTFDNVWAYSDDGGATWTTAAVDVDGDSTPRPRSLAYDDRRAVWVATFTPGRFSGDVLKVWTTATPLVSDSWVASAAAVDSRGLRGESVALLSSIVTSGDRWIVTANSLNFANIVISDDGGATWTTAAAIVGSSAGFAALVRKTGRYLAVGITNQTLAISGPLWG